MLHWLGELGDRIMTDYKQYNKYWWLRLHCIKLGWELEGATRVAEYNYSWVFVHEVIDNGAMSRFSGISAHYIYWGREEIVKLLNTIYQWLSPSTTCNPFRNPCIGSIIFRWIFNWEFLHSFTFFCRLQCFWAALCTLFEEESCVFKVASLDCLM